MATAAYQIEGGYNCDGIRQVCVSSFTRVLKNCGDKSFCDTELFEWYLATRHCKYCDTGCVQTIFTFKRYMLIIPHKRTVSFCILPQKRGAPGSFSDSDVLRLGTCIAYMGT
ncbi:uncharacterized protein LOC115890179 [Sitophilus oryzae]|uniref:Uncharacterized protein LOC115890179 n=1 Tax=Sitophilus oryzae TaxID=7048 RepID=A0A6J2YSH7_SITOR|nr:uncharacterized protein LOC115890179 [Sitophilus oryzae]